MTRSIESWFDVRVDKALEGGLNLSRGMLDNMLKDLAAKADRMALALSTRPPAEHLAALNALREQAGVPEATLFSAARASVLAYSGERARRPDARGAGPRSPAPDPRRSKAIRRSKRCPTRDCILRVLVPVPVVSLADEARVLQVVQTRARSSSTQDAEAVQSGYREYQELTLSRRGLKRLYALTLTLTLLLALLSARGARVRALGPAVGAAGRAGGGHARGGAAAISAGARRWHRATRSAC